MAKPQLFISHSTSANEAAKQTLLALVDAIKDECLLLFDRSSLRSGEDWRSAINVWTGTCDVALLFLTPEAVESEYCQYEWSILSYRRKLVPTFRVIPIYSGVTRAQLGSKPHQITEIQDEVVFDTVDNAAAAIIGLLRTVQTGDLPSELQAELIARLLARNVERPVFLKQAAKLGSFELGQWNPFEDEWKRFALQLMGIGLRRATIALRELKAFFDRAPSDLDELHRLVAASWVDMCAAGVIWTARGAAIAPAFALNADTADTATLYVQRASGRSPANPWMLTSLPDAFGDLESLRLVAASSLASILGMDTPLAATVDAVRDELRAWIANMNEPVFLAAPAGPIDSQWLRTLRETFPGLSVFLLTGLQGWPTLADDDVTVLAPPIAEGFEAKFWGEYAQTKKDLKR